MTTVGGELSKDTLLFYILTIYKTPGFCGIVKLGKLSLLLRLTVRTRDVLV
jgi:hypothetical protein